MDITERMKAEEALAESERRFATVLANAHAYRCRNEPSYANEFASEYALDLTGYTPEELMVDGEVRFGDLIVEEDKKRVWEEVQRALGRGEPFEVRYAIRGKDGTLRHVQEYGRGVYGEEGEVVALEGLVYDVTERAVRDHPDDREPADLRPDRGRVLRSQKAGRGAGRVTRPWAGPRSGPASRA